MVVFEKVRVSVVKENGHDHDFESEQNHMRTLRQHVKARVTLCSCSADIVSMGVNLQLRSDSPMFSIVITLLVSFSIS